MMGFSRVVVPNVFHYIQLIPLYLMYVYSTWPQGFSIIKRRFRLPLGSDLWTNYEGEYFLFSFNVFSY